MVDFIRIDGSHLVKNGQIIQLRGVSLGNWLMLEDFMSGIPYVEHKMRELFIKVIGKETGTSFFDTYQQTYITEDDFQYLHKLGVNFIRLPFNYRLFEDGMNPGYYKEKGFQYLNKAIEWCKKYKMYVMLDLHAAPGCQAIDYNVDCVDPVAHFWTEKQFQWRTIDLWKAIAERYKNETTIMGYEVLNEPVAPEPQNPNHELLRNFYREIIPAIREIDKNHLIVLNGNQWGRDIESLSNDLFDDPQVLYEAHYYPYETIPFSELKSYPCTDATREILKKGIMNVCDLKRIKRPVLFGEFGIKYDQPYIKEFHYSILEDVIDIFNELGYHWSIWSYKDLKSMGFANPNNQSAWKQFLARKDVIQLHTDLNDLCSVNYDAGTRKQSWFYNKVHDLFPEMDEEYTKHRVREARRNLDWLHLHALLLKMKEYSEQEIMQMAASFSFENCIINKKAEKVIKNALK